MRVKLSVSNSVLDFFFFLIFAQFGDKLIQGLFEIFKDFCSYVQLRKKEKRLARNVHFWQTVFDSRQGHVLFNRVQK